MLRLRQMHLEPCHSLDFVGAKVYKRRAYSQQSAMFLSGEVSAARNSRQKDGTRFATPVTGKDQDAAWLAVVVPADCATIYW